MRILSIGFHDPPVTVGWPGYSVPGSCWRFAQGFAELGHDVVPVNIKLEPLRDELLEGADVCWLAGEQFRWWHPAEAERWVPAIADRMPIMVNYCDIREPEPWFEFAAKHAAVLFHGAGGWCLERFLEAGFRRVGFLPGPAFDWRPYLGGQLSREIEWFFSGSVTELGDGERNRDVLALGNFVGWRNFFTPGFNEPYVSGRAHAELMWRSKRGLVVSHFHDRPKYTSMRTWAYMLAGIDVAVRRFDGCDEILPPEACVYSTRDELLELAEQPRDEQRAAAMRSYIRENLSPKKLAELALLYLEGPAVFAPRCNFAWAELVGS